jgi:hypothetical protein
MHVRYVVFDGSVLTVRATYTTRWPVSFAIVTSEERHKTFGKAKLLAAKLLVNSAAYLTGQFSKAWSSDYLPSS